MGQQSSRTAAAQPAPSPEAEARTPSGLTPRNPQARISCNAKRVRRLIRQGRLAPCYAGALAQGAECPVCFELYIKLNRTACCHQEICTECFIAVVAPSSGPAQRCPYCQAGGLQVYLPRPPSPPAPVEQQPNSGPAALEAAVSGGEQHPAMPAGWEEQLDGMERSGSTDSTDSGTTTTSSSSSSSQSSSQPGDASVAARAVAGVQGQGREAAGKDTGVSCTSASKPCCTGSGAPLGLPCSLQALAEAAAEASRQQGPAIVGMVLQGTGGGGPSGSTPSSSSPPPAGGPALLLNPDGTEQLVLLSSGQPEEGAAAVQQAQQQHGGTAAAAPASPLDERICQAVALADAALLAGTAAVGAQLPASAFPPGPGDSPGDTWLERLQRADAALQAAVQRNDQQHFAFTGSAAGNGGAAGGGSGSN